MIGCIAFDVTQAPAYYNFNWLVKDDPSYNNYGQSESRNGDKTEGSYSGKWSSAYNGEISNITKIY